mmetsp:Transcript_12880/g.19324  ORF Transcript_12880/g.19324 Transcript_12880/m.19324 type:complete len:390 (-) Transcript_12880:110-1279(-)
MMSMASHRLMAASARNAARQLTSTATRSSTTVASTAPRSQFRNPNFVLGIGSGLVLAGLHSATGSANDFYDYRFKSPKDADDLASFYGGEELMELYCVFPIVGQIMMRSATFDDTGGIKTQGFPGTMEVNMVFSDDVNQDTGETDWFNKRERFKNTLFGYTLWDMVINFGFQTKDDGSRECYHAGEYFHGNVPILSQVMLLIFKVHARWVVWSTEHHVNHYAFSSGTTDEEEEMEEESRANMPLFLLKNYAWSDLTAMLFGYKEGDLSRAEKQPSFLLLGGKDSEKDELPFQKKAIQIRISEDIEADKQAMKALSSKYCPEDVKKILARRATIARRRTNAKQEVSGDEDDVDVDEEAAATSDVYVMATELAADRAMRRMTRRPTRAATN